MDQSEAEEFYIDQSEAGEFCIDQSEAVEFYMDQSEAGEFYIYYPPPPLLTPYNIDKCQVLIDVVNGRTDEPFGYKIDDNGIIFYCLFNRNLYSIKKNSYPVSRTASV